MKHLVHFFLIFYFSAIIFFCSTIMARSVHRPPETWLPTITSHWLDEQTSFTLRDSHLEEYPFFDVFDQDLFTKNLLPKNAITFRNHPEATVDGEILSTLIEKLLTEVMLGKKHFTDFIVLKNDDFNRHKRWGLIIAKFKKYPFVIKLSFETPEGITHPESHGFIPLFFFYMGGGVNRHLTGFTRVSHSHTVKKRLEMDPYWSEHVDVPRKWFWLPQNSRSLEICGTNIGGKNNLRTQIPGIYAVVADAIDAKYTFSLKKKEDRIEALKIANFLELQVDPHIDNFLVERETGKIVIIDTEHFPTVVGYKNIPHYDSYLSWYTGLISKCSQDMLFRTKKERKAHALLSAAQPRPCIGSWCENRMA